MGSLFFSKVGVDSFCCVRSVVAICGHCGLKTGSSYIDIDIDVASCCIYPRAQQQSAPGLLNFQFSTVSGSGCRSNIEGCLLISAQILVGEPFFSHKTTEKIDVLENHHR